MSDVSSNYSIRDEIREFWSERAATFDESVGHEIFSEAERAGWHGLIWVRGRAVRRSIWPAVPG